jgi:hypothetical protein
MCLFFHTETGDAIKVSHDGDANIGVWLPKSQIEYQFKSPSTVVVTAPEWLIIEKGLELHVL